MTGLVGLVPLAELLAALTGSRHGATSLAIALIDQGGRAVPAGRNDLNQAAQRELVSTGVLTEAGVLSPGRAGELVVVCELLAASTLPSPAPRPDPRLVLSAPPGSIPLLDGERLEGLVLDVIRQATETLVIGGAFWNDAGFEMLNEVLVPAVQTRGVATSVYVNPPAPEHQDLLTRRLEGLRQLGSVQVRWFCGARPTMLHAKFVIRDRCQGYLGTANLTSWGLAGHIEAGVELTAGQSDRFVRFLEQLDASALFAARPPQEGSHSA